MKTKKRKFVRIGYRELVQRRKDEAKQLARLKSMNFVDPTDLASVSNALYRRDSNRIAIAERDDAAFMETIKRASQDTLKSV